MTRDGVNIQNSLHPTGKGHNRQGTEAWRKRVVAPTFP